MGGSPGWNVSRLGRGKNLPRPQTAVPSANNRGSWYTRKGGGKGEITDLHGACVPASVMRNP